MTRSYIYDEKITIFVLNDNYSATSDLKYFDNAHFNVFTRI